MTSSEEVNRRELLVSGFVRNMEKEYEIENIPLEINDIIYLYQKYCDEWSQDLSGDGIIIDQTQNIMIIDKSEPTTAYGSTTISEGSFVWRLKLLKLNRHLFSAPPYIGIIKDEPDNLKQYRNDADWEQVGYQLCAGRGKLWIEWGSEAIEKDKDGDLLWIEPGDIIEITLDLNQQLLYFEVNGKKNGFKNISKTKYRLALSVRDLNGSKFQLL